MDESSDSAMILKGHFMLPVIQNEDHSTDSAIHFSTNLNIPGLKCFVPYCRSGDEKSEKIREVAGFAKPLFFTVPKDAKKRGEWQLVIGRADVPLTKDDFVCSLHFTEDDFMRFYVKWYNCLAIHKCKIVPALRAGAVPSIFPAIFVKGFGLRKKIPKSLFLKSKILKEYGPQAFFENLAPELLNNGDCKSQRIESIQEEKEDEVRSFFNDDSATGSSDGCYHPNYLEDDIFLKDLFPETIIDEDFLTLDRHVLPSNELCIPQQFRTSDSKLFYNVPQEAIEIIKVNPNCLCMNDSGDLYVMEDLQDESPITFNGVMRILKSNRIKNAANWLYSFAHDNQLIVIMYLDNHESFSVTKKILIDQELKIKVFLGEVNVKIDKFDVLKEKKDVDSLLWIVEGMKTCASVKPPKLIEEKYKCSGFNNSRLPYCLCCQTNKKLTLSKDKTIKKQKEQIEMLKKANAGCTCKNKIKYSDLLSLNTDLKKT